MPSKCHNFSTRTAHGRSLRFLGYRQFSKSLFNFFFENFVYL